MHLYFNFGELSIPSYGLAIVLGIIIANLIALYPLKRYKLDINNFIILEAYIFLGGFIGSKLLYFIVAFRSIHWDKIFELNYFNQLMGSGFVFYGGLLGGLLSVVLAGKLHHIDYKTYMKNFIFLIPLVHSFGRIGCFLAGCCYGIPYTGPFSVIFPENSFALANVKLFPIQLVEAFLLIVLALSIFIGQMYYNLKNTIETYLISYSVIRFILEFFRYDVERGRFLLFSTSQWISIGIFVIVTIYLLIKVYKNTSFCAKI